MGYECAAQVNKWRPTTAVRARDDPTWESLLAVAAHPEYPSAHQAVFGGGWCVCCCAPARQGTQNATDGQPNELPVVHAFPSMRFHVYSCVSMHARRGILLQYFNGNTSIPGRWHIASLMCAHGLSPTPLSALAPRQGPKQQS